MPADIYFDQLAHRWEEEGLFARDVNGQLIREVPKTENDYHRFVTVVIDGQAVQVPKAVHSTDAQGNIIRIDAAGRTLPRATTILDAVSELIKRGNADRRAEDPHATLLDSPVPTICHLDHLKPVGVCRVCSVAVETFEVDPKDPTKKKPKRQEKLVPACVQPVEDHMIVHTLASPDAKQRGKVESSVRVLLELLAADHLAPASPTTTQPERPSDLQRLVTRYEDQLQLDPSRFAPHEPLRYAADESSPLIAVDHNSCILCDRCVRACSDVKQNFVIGRNGKGYTARIGFDLNDPMGESSCVECGECMLSCPTSALTFRQPILSDWWEEQVQSSGANANKQKVLPHEMQDNVLLRTLPWKYREWNQASVIRWKVRKGDEICALGEYGSTAFIMNEGEFGGWKRDELKNTSPPDFTLSPKDLLFGEMTCLNNYPRNATIKAITDGEVFEVRRNVLFTLQQVPEAREMLDRVYRNRALFTHLNEVELFRQLLPAERETVLAILNKPIAPAALPGETPASAIARRGVDLVRVGPGETIFRQGERADCFYMIRLGHIKVTQTYGGEERVVSFLKPNTSFGEIACIGDWEELRALIPAELIGPLTNRRSASCIALDHAELVRIDVTPFRQMLQEIPSLRKKIVDQAAATLAQEKARNGAPIAPTRSSAAVRQFTDQGLYNAQRLLVLDLEACTRCDECSKACSDTHQGVTRLIRDGLRFDKWLVASSCRSCTDPYCLMGCPVDAIHRDGEGKEIRIENHCIGCGLCASNCPYGNINMHTTQIYDKQRKQAVLENKATTCDLCTQIVGNDYRNVSCVFACPHNAAFRMSGDELFAKLQ